MKCPKEIVRTCGARPPDLRKRRVKLSKRWVPGLLCIAGITIAFQQRGHNALPVTTEKARIRDLVHLVSGTGKIRPEREVKISSEAAGEIIEMPVQLGQRVKTGDLLVRIRPDNYIAAVKQAEAALTAAKADSSMRKAEMLNNDLDRSRSKSFSPRN